MACTISVRHGYGRSRGVHFSCTPPLGSRGVQIFLYAFDNHSSYDLFPSSEVGLVGPGCGSFLLFFSLAFSFFDFSFTAF
jgi:hypothetical protein